MHIYWITSNILIKSRTYINSTVVSYNGLVEVVVIWPPSHHSSPNQGVVVRSFSKFSRTKSTWRTRTSLLIMNRPWRGEHLLARSRPKSSISWCCCPFCTWSSRLRACCNCLMVQGLQRGTKWHYHRFCWSRNCWTGELILVSIGLSPLPDIGIDVGQ